MCTLQHFLFNLSEGGGERKGRGKEGEREGELDGDWEREIGGKEMWKKTGSTQGCTRSSNMYITMQVVESHNILPQKSLSPRISNR